MSAFQEGGALSGDRGGFCHPSHGHVPWAMQFQTLQDAPGSSSFAPGWHCGVVRSEGHLPHTPEAALCPFPSFPPHPAAPCQQLAEGSSMCRFEHLSRPGDPPMCPLPHSTNRETPSGIPSPSFSALPLPAQAQHWPCSLSLGWGNGPITEHPPTPDRPCRASRCPGCKSQDCLHLGWDELMAKGWELIRPRGGEENSSQVWC